MNKTNKTNAMRLMDAAKIPYRAVEYEYDESDLGGEHVAAVTGMNPDQVFKTLVARGEKKGILVFCIPVSCTLDLKKAAHAAGDKKVEMIHMKELLGLTGYIRGGCSPVGMKKKYPTFMDETAELYDEIAISGGARGLQMVLSPMSLMEYADITSVDLVEY
ncbi:MAG: Cys-tRNA(Pro) deacylase [Oscillospiraceae bacterium]|nr:Cys-tRNA(Pro) deacylase [Oscillospiraceae bacterium]